MNSEHKLSAHKHILTRMVLVAGLIGVAASANAATYQYHYPVKGLVAQAVSAPAVSLVLGGSLPDAYVGPAYQFDLATLLSSANGTPITEGQVSWSITGLPVGLQLSGSSIVGSAASAASASVSVTATYQGRSVTKAFSLLVSSYASCLQYLNANPGTPSGSYVLDVDGAGPAVSQSYYCDMTSDGGGWTKVVQQTEAAPVLNWSGGVNGNSFTLSSAQIPSHSQVAFGYNNVATAVDYVTWNYSTSDIPTVLVNSPKTGSQFYVHRSSTQWYADHDPQMLLVNGTGDGSGTWVDTLTFIKKGAGTGANAYGWSFSARNETAAYRGFRLYGTKTIGADAGAWTVWVR